MSAICGIFRLGEAPLQLDLLGRMMRAMEKHGPDGKGSWHDESAGLGHQMMHITPESLDEQLPLHHGESRITLTADARLDNREELLQALGIPPWKQLPDSGIMLQAYQRWGTACADRLVGEFAFAIWDARSRCLHCFTDPMGVRPLFYTEAPGRYFAFASEVESLRMLTGSPAQIDNRRLAMLGVSAMTAYLEPNRTCFENIRRISAATVLSVNTAGKTASEYWRPDPGKRLHFKSDAECREAFLDVFFKAVKGRLRSAFPVASLLSGGLDSSAIVGAASALLAKENRRLLTLSSVPMPDSEGRVTDEREYIDLFKGWKNLEMRYVTAQGCGPFDELDRLVETASLCSYSYQHFLYSVIVRAARENNARVILDGDGGELSASCNPSGYLAELLLAGSLTRLTRELRHIDANQRIHWTAVKRNVLRPLVPYALQKLIRRQRRFSDLIEYPIQEGFVRDVLGSDVERTRELVNRMLKEYPDHRKNMAHHLLLEQRDLRQRSHAGFVDYHQARFSYPFLDKRVLEFALAIDGRFKYKDGQSRRLLRLGMAGLLPERLLSRTSKAPFSPDYHLRYEKQKSEAFSLLKDFSAIGKLNGIVDFDRALTALDSTPAYRAKSPMDVDRDSQCTVPYATYLCYFLKRFGS